MIPDINAERARFPQMVKAMAVVTKFVSEERWRPCCEAYKVAFRNSKCVDGTISIYRTHNLIGCCTILRDKTDLPVPDDEVFLKSISKDNSESLHLRLLARQTLSNIRYDQGNREKTAYYQRSIIEQGERATNAERNLTTFFIHPTTYVQGVQSVGPLIQYIVDQEKENLEGLSPQFIMSSTNRAQAEAEAKAEAERRGQVMGGLTSVTTLHNASPENFDALTPGGSQCDACKAAAPSDGLKTCSKCRIYYYCSTSCQKEHWKRHKAFCVEKGQFLMGDRALVMGLVARPELNAIVVTLSSAESNADGRWICTTPDLKQIKVKSENLKRLRPVSH